MVFSIARLNRHLQSSGIVNIHDDATASVVTGSVDVGGWRASMAMIAAEVLGLDLNRVRSLVSDTDSIRYTDNTAGSRTTLATGLVVFEAGKSRLLRCTIAQDAGKAIHPS